MVATLSYKCAAALFCFLSILSFEINMQETPPAVGRALCIESVLARGAETAAPSSPQFHSIRLFKVKIVKKYPHDPEAFTQGLVFANGFLYESTGLHGKSSLRQVELETGRIVKKYELPPQYFAEGLTLWGRSLIQLTWMSGKGFVYNTQSFSVEREFSYSGEGWGLTHDGKSLIMSNGTAKLIFLDPATLVQQHSLPVLDRGRPVQSLNELEYIKGEIFANIWQTDFVARISPKTGEVTGWIEMSDLRKELPPASHAEVLNGIAYDAQKDRIFVTGKLWPLLFEIELTEHGD
ncbi:MAG: glutaminyl-peptide cyclotransferase [Syntrophobacteraceae bacterium]|jgi:glutamine cyclotransferase